MVGVSGTGGDPRTAPTDSASEGAMLVADQMIGAVASADDSIRQFRVADYTGDLTGSVNPFLPIFDGAVGAVVPSVETGSTVSSASSGSFVVDQPALPSDARGHTGEAAPGVKSATSRSASHGGRVVAAVAAHLSGHVVAVGAQHDRADVLSGGRTILVRGLDEPSLHQ